MCEPIDPRSRKNRDGVLYVEHVPLRAGLPLLSLWSFESATSDTSREPVRVSGDGTQSYWLSAQDPLLNTLLPSTHVSLVINAADTWAAGRSLVDAQLLPHACVIGPMMHSRILRVGRRVCAFGAVIPAQMAMSVFGVAARGLVERVVPLRDLWPGALAQELTEGASSLSVRNRITERLSSGACSGSNVEYDAASALAFHGGRLSVDALARSCGVSRRTLTRRFVSELGIAPKLYARITRFNRLVSALLSTDASRWATLATDLGFFDQPHMVNEFRQFTGLSPLRFFHQRGELPPRRGADSRGRPCDWIRQTHNNARHS